jgi:tetratricopeptide (TPR) repeat protein
MMVDTDKMYERMMHDFAWRELDNPDIYYNGYYYMYAQNQRANFNTLAEALIEEGKAEKAKNALLKSLEVMPDRSLPYDVASVQAVALLLGLGETEKADHIAQTMSQRADELLDYLTENNNPLYERQKMVSLFALNRFANFYHQAGRTEDSIRYQTIFEKYYN